MVSFDTLAYSDNLEKQGFTTQQAKALANENKRAFNELVESR